MTQGTKNVVHTKTVRGTRPVSVYCIQSGSIMSNIKLTYFNGRGLAETIRWLLKYGNIDFEDIRIERDDWAAVKSTTPFGQAPVYEENGKVAWQSLSIARYVAKKVKLAGDNDWECLEIDAVADTFNDIRLKLYPLHTESDPDKKAKLKETLLTETIPYYLERLDKLTTKNNGYLAANKLSWVDFYFSVAIESFNTLLGESVVEKYSGLSNLNNKVRDIPVIKAWIKARPETPF